MRYVNREVEGASHRSKDMINITEPLQMIRMDFYGSVNVMSANKARYLFAMIIDYSRFFRVVRMCSKDETSQMKVDQDEPRSLINPERHHSCQWPIRSKH